MESEFKEEMNGLKISVDWVSFTCEVGVSYEFLISQLGFQLSDFEELERGMHGYRKQLKHKVYSIRVLHDGNSDMGVHLIISGSAIAPTLKQFVESPAYKEECPFGGGAIKVENLGETVLCTFIRNLVGIGHFTRIDLAIDDCSHCGFSPSEVIAYIDNKQCVSKFRTRRNLDEKDFAGNEKGHTVYFGSGASDFMVRLYDKKLEQESKGNIVESNVWYRWELELKKEYAHKVASAIASNEPVANLAIGILSNYIRFINLDKNNRSRCSTIDKWARFIAGCEQLQLFVPMPPKTIDDKKKWIEKQVAPSLAAIVVADGGGMDGLYKMIESGWQRANKTLKGIAVEDSEVIVLTDRTKYFMRLERQKKIFAEMDALVASGSIAYDYKKPYYDYKNRIWW